MGKHTSGPWHINRRGYETFYIAHEFVEDEHGVPVCGVWNPEREDQTANTKLIAAAPELLEALWEAFGQIDQNTHRKTWEKCRAAIAKATGEA